MLVLIETQHKRARVHKQVVHCTHTYTHPHIVAAQQGTVKASDARVGVKVGFVFSISCPYYPLWQYVKGVCPNVNNRWEAALEVQGSALVEMGNSIPFSWASYTSTRD